ncbi:DAK2 domain-containing protein [Nonomuraea sp. NEAU-A123]|uniref:DAK2 domain-containing protein n=1 Tax=Nonomuraea sp. NEAU-A123 TaxID=2839649 RepID=UPI001BE41C2E|nr:DAK2 domain-containing protein [Nonomuraea sp. NEAU-A123]MBT2232112.1 DAK2 domain-containing protein [Nonomuraea sp. NEAU-A123]
MTASPVLRRYAAGVDAAHAELTRLDQLSGDGDFGDNLRSGLRRVIDELDRAGTAGHGFDVAGRVFLDDVGGTSGPLFGLLFTELGQALDGSATEATDASGAGSDVAGAVRDVRRWAVGASAGLAAIQRVGEAEVGDCTLVDALVPAVAALEDDGAGAFARAAEAAADGARSTAELRARLGRASYVGDRAKGVADPGAVGVALLFWALAEVEEPGSGVTLPY